VDATHYNFYQKTKDVKMRGHGCFGFSYEQQTEIWIRWKNGDSLSDIGRALRKHPGSVHHLIAFHGGISPPKKKRSKFHLSIEEREEISRGLAASRTVRDIALHLNRSPSTISREINRHGGKESYRASVADQQAWKNAARPKPSLLDCCPNLKEIVIEKLNLKWSPEQISGWLKETYPIEPMMHISHETIYKSLFIQARGALKKELTQHLRTRRLMRRPKNAKIDRAPRGQIIDAVSIRERPAEVEDRAIPGHWEGDLLSGSKNTHIATLVERTTRFTILVKLKGKDTVSVVNALRDKIKKLPDNLRNSLTWDRGMELAFHKQLSVDTNIQIYFCDPRSPWQRGTNENTNGLLRQYLPSKTDLSVFTQKALDKIALELNERPRKTLNFCSPLDKFKLLVASTA
jgi:IS30 family transposase